jgi:hypothetical protein
VQQGDEMEGRWRTTRNFEIKHYGDAAANDDNPLIEHPGIWNKCEETALKTRDDNGVMFSSQSVLSAQCK